jgi:hypothetical protein
VSDTDDDMDGDMTRDPAERRRDDEEAQDAPPRSERAATHEGTEDLAPGVLMDGHAEIQPDPFPSRPDDEGEDEVDRDVLREQREHAEVIEHGRAPAANETLGTVGDDATGRSGARGGTTGRSGIRGSGDDR